MDEQTGSLLIGYIGLLSVIVGFFWMENWLYSKKKVARHWLYAVALLVLMVSVVFFLREGSPRGIFFTMLLLISACVVGAILGGIFGQFFHENPQQEDKTG